MSFEMGDAALLFGVYWKCRGCSRHPPPRLGLICWVPVPPSPGTRQTDWEKWQNYPRFSSIPAIGAKM